ncbi:putative signal transduction protein with CBS domains [Ignisphaera aggregans DSM 17230]|uniref:Putative signal transduction protein with CBS domains n=1 Tax=Ignisphaera aggregans (strain DSM 17230 / JCM 13409 / AQ1.S1) TaxID=583356 RepID=E0SQ13_IGNAA|nr:putative signal transduction protein with CBS domains [Ignisphaera aggregans DSM 17230]
MRAEDIMKKPIAVKEDVTIGEASKIMDGNNIGSLPIVDDNGKLIGIVTERDIVRAISRGVKLDIPVKHIMSTKLIVADRDENIVSIAIKMIENNIRHIPIVDNDHKLIGIISIRDVLRYVLASNMFP